MLHRVLSGLRARRHRNSCSEPPAAASHREGHRRPGPEQRFAPPQRRSPIAAGTAGPGAPGARRAPAATCRPRHRSVPHPITWTRLRSLKGLKSPTLQAQSVTAQKGAEKGRKQAAKALIQPLFPCLQSQRDLVFPLLVQQSPGGCVARRLNQTSYTNSVMLQTHCLSNLGFHQSTWVPCNGTRCSAPGSTGKARPLIGQSKTHLSWSNQTGKLSEKMLESAHGNTAGTQVSSFYPRTFFQRKNRV